MSSPDNPQPNPDLFDGTWNSTSLIVLICTSLSLYNSLELLLLILTTFKTWRGLYFWSLLVASFGIIPYCTGFLVEYFHLTHPAVGKAIDSYGWITLITGQALVLYSRLNLVLSNVQVLTGVKWMIIVDAVVLHISTTVVLFAGHYGSHQASASLAYLYIEKIQMTVFCIQEFILSGLYVWKTTHLLQTVSKAKAETRRVMWQLFSINVAIIAMDIALLAIEYRNLHVQEQTFKSLIYSVKLKLEFAILGKLIDLVQSGRRTLSAALADQDTYVDVSRARTASDVIRFPSHATNSPNISRRHPHSLTQTQTQIRSQSQSQQPHWMTELTLDEENEKKLPPNAAVQHIETAPDLIPTSKQNPYSSTSSSLILISSRPQPQPQPRPLRHVPQRILLPIRCPNGHAPQSSRLGPAVRGGDAVDLAFVIFAEPIVLTCVLGVGV